jgi:2-dehydropantoate 2-reductase
MIKRNKSKNIVFVGNNMTVEKYENLENKNVLFAFFSAAGKKYDGYINSICLNKIETGIETEAYDKLKVDFLHYTR